MPLHLLKQAEDESFFAFFDEDQIGRFYFCRYVAVRSSSVDAFLSPFLLARTRARTGMVAPTN